MHMDRIFAAAQPTLATAREQAIKHGYHYFLSLTSTPNGAEGEGQFFYNYWQNAVDSDMLFQPVPGYENETNRNLIYENFKPDVDSIVEDPTKNSFVRVKYHWSEDPRKSEAWYRSQCQELNFNSRKIAQELDLDFVGSANCIFDDEVLKKLKENIIKPIGLMPLCHGAFLKVYKEIDPDDYYIVGVDTASSTEGAFSAVEVYSFKNFEQVAELNIRTGTLTAYGEMVEEICKLFIEATNHRVIIAVENNSIGKTIVEHLRLHGKDGADYTQYLYFEKSKQHADGTVSEYGLNTNSRTKDLMASSFMDFSYEGPEYFHSEELITQLHGITRSNSGTLSHTSYSDIANKCILC